MKKNGFVLIETIIVMSILAIGLISLYSSYVLIIRSTLNNTIEVPKDTYIAYQIHQNYNYSFMGLIDKPYYIEIYKENESFYQRECGLDFSNNPVCSSSLDLDDNQNDLYLNLDINKIYYTNKSLGDLLEKNVLLNFDGTSINYIRSLQNDENIIPEATKTVIVKVDNKSNGYDFSYYQD